MDYFFPFLRFLFIYSLKTQRERDTGRGRSMLHAGSPMRDSIPGLQDQALGQRLLSHPGCPMDYIFLEGKLHVLLLPLIHASLEVGCHMLPGTMLSSS